SGAGFQASREPEPAPAWPDVRLTTAPWTAPAGFGVRRVLLDAGHGAAGNSGNLSAFCEREEDFTLELAADLAGRLEATGHFEVRVSRRPGELVDYHQRVAEAETWGADAFVSLHSDVRGTAGSWSPEP